MQARACPSLRYALGQLIAIICVPKASTSLWRVTPRGDADSSNCEEKGRDARKRCMRTLLGAPERLTSVQKPLAYTADVESPWKAASKLAHTALATCSSSSARPTESWGREIDAARQAMNHSQDLAGRLAYKVFKETGSSGLGAREIFRSTFTR